MRPLATQTDGQTIAVADAATGEKAQDEQRP